MKVRALLIIATIAVLETVAVADGAEDLYAQGQTAYDKADYPAAIAKWQASFDLSGENGLLFNIAQAKRLAGDCAGALATYKKFIGVDPDLASEQHKLAEDFARELERACVPQAPFVSSKPVAVREDRPEHPERPLRTAGIVTGGAGIALLATGLVLGHHGQTLGNEVTAACHAICDWGAQKDKDAAGHRDVTIGLAIDVAGAAGIVGGAVMYYLGVRENSVAIGPIPGEGGAGISWSGAW